MRGTTSSPARYFDARGNAVRLGSEIGSGGEGAVFEMADDPRRVAKIYHWPVSDEKADKLRAMAAQASQDLVAFASWPLEVLHNGRAAQIGGIVLPRVRDHDEIHKLYSPAQRKLEYPDKDWGFLVHSAMNCAAAFDAIHSKGHVIGDVNQGNVLVSQRGTVFLIDCDSFQVNTDGRKFLCEVGVPQYTPPELQGRSFRGLERTANHDRFGLALVIFHLLFMGRHPFAGRFQGRGDMPIEQAIAEYRYAFSRRASELQMAAPPQTLPPEEITPELALLFARAFERGSEQSDARPTAQEWHATLATELKRLTTCPTDRGHRYTTAVAKCPWCRLMASGAPNFFLSVTFRGTSPEVLNVTPEILTMFQAAERAAPPRHRPLPLAPASVLRVEPTPPPPAVESAQALTTMVKYVAGASLLGMGVMFVVPESGYLSVPMFGVFAAWWSVMWLVSGHRPERRRRRQVLRARRGQLRQLQSAWHGAISAADSQFQQTRKELNTARDQIAQLRPLFEAELRTLGRDVQERQLKAFLQGKFLSEQKIDGFGPGRIATLASYGIETAYDIEYNRVLAVPGLGPALTNNLCNWRSVMARPFKPNLQQGIPGAERQSLLLKYYQVRQQCESRLRGAPEQLGEQNAQLQKALDRLAGQIEAAHLAVAQATADLAVMGDRGLVT